MSWSAGLPLFLFNAKIGLAELLASVVVNVNRALVPVPATPNEVRPVIDDALIVPFTSSNADGEEVLIPIREFVTSR